MPWRNLSGPACSSLYLFYRNAFVHVGIGIHRKPTPQLARASEPQQL